MTVLGLGIVADIPAQRAESVHRGMLAQVNQWSEGYGYQSASGVRGRGAPPAPALPTARPAARPALGPA